MEKKPITEASGPKKWPLPLIGSVIGALILVGVDIFFTVHAMQGELSSKPISITTTPPSKVMPLEPTKAEIADARPTNQKIKYEEDILVNYNNIRSQSQYIRHQPTKVIGTYYSPVTNHPAIKGHSQSVPLSHTVNPKPAAPAAPGNNTSKSCVSPAPPPQKTGEGTSVGRNHSPATKPNKTNANPPAVKPVPTNPSNQQNRMKMAAWLPFWSSSTASVTLESQPIDSINLFMYELGANGQVGYMQYAKGENKQVLSTARKRGISILATVGNTAGWSDYDKASNDLHNLIARPESRSKLADNLVQFVLKQHYDGLDIDLEVIKGADRNNFSLFMEELSQKLHQQNKKLSICVYVKTSDDDSWDGPRAQDWKRLGQAVDEFKIMAFNYSMIKPGPGTPVYWLDQMINYAKTQVPAKKVYIGLPTYGYFWSSDGSRSALTYKKAQKLISEHHVQVQRDENGEPYFTYTENGKTYTGYYQDHLSWQKKIDFIKTKHPDIGGVCEWYLGAEEAAIWNTVNSEVTSSPE